MIIIMIVIIMLLLEQQIQKISDKFFKIDFYNPYLKINQY